MRLNQILIGLGLLLLLAPIVLPAPPGMSDTAWIALGLALVMALWWLTEALPLPATALLPLAVAPILGIAALEDTARSYSDPLVILFLGGFLIAKAIEKSSLHRRLAGVLLRLAGTSPRQVLAAIMLSTAFLSLWISNTASAMVVAPIAAAIASSQRDYPDFGTTLMLGVAFSATIGGMGSLIGTPPNAIFASYVSTTYGLNVGFAQWAAVGMPVALVLLLLAWLVLVWVSPRLGKKALTMSYGRQQAGMQTAERRVAIVAGLTALAWLSRPLIEWLIPMITLSDAGISMLAALALFMIPDGENGRLLDWDTAGSLRWDVLILFGGGLALAGIIQQSGLADWIGSSVQLIAHWPQLTVLFVIAALIVYVGELASNTAMAAIFLPIAGAVATGLGTDPVAFILPIALAASIGFMLPVATPPNAIVFASHAVTRSSMLRAGAPLDVIALFITLGAGSILGPLVFR
ncbi:DASS family sodium-coupled anion symporter [Sulfitobacter sp. JBTF-M27]|uniref:DASS family sodium-coupled anion symporter n=1 Tax=Sulfitobacter sediminilitoris TaxID=2698830 RepID=A0A6P0CHA6_9RHOB|nr:SLC13 family permease [Sulfitobacter sediminilitoris]NEK24435.1 DASS family sodium-coupled anion symporter [Sulfitobacter sediminilitoris]